MKKFSYKKILTYLAIITIFGLFPLLKVNAGDVEPLSVTGPKDLEVTSTDPLNFSFTFKIPKPTANPDVNHMEDLIIFQPSADGVDSKALTIFQQKKTNTADVTKTITWKDSSAHSVSAKIYSYRIYDYYTKTEYVNKTFIFKTNTNFKGWYYATKNKTSTGTLSSQFSEFYYNVSSKFVDEPTCKNDLTAYLAKESTATLYLDCKESDFPPSVTQGIISELTPVDTSIHFKEDYNLLAPIGNLDKIDKNTNVGDYLNILFKIIIGLCGVLAVVMIVIGGIQYMGEDSVFSKTEAKSRITNAIFGLLLALGAFALLNTINPDLLGGKGVNIALKRITLEDEGVLVDPSASTAPCTEGACLVDWAKQNGKKITMILKSGEKIEITPCDTTLIKEYSDLFGGKTIKINQYLHNGLKRISDKNKNYPINTAVGYYCKLITTGGTTANDRAISFHSYGLAIDINSAKNGRNGTIGDMPASFIYSWTVEKWIWGGNWENPDPMHFSMGERSKTIIGEN